jgi:GMP synthase (glutamine-hydrolysing)
VKTVTAICHVAFEDLGSFEPEFQSFGYTIKYLEAGRDDLGRVIQRAPDILVILGGPIGAGNESDYPFLKDELAVLGQRARANLPTLGICLGSQLMARALGARVYPADRKEIGWAPIALTDAGWESCLAALAPEEEPVLHWHGDTFDLPQGAVHLASSEICRHQAFAWGDNWLAFQFHPEATVRGLERWFIGHAGEIAVTEGVSVARLRADTARWGRSLEARGIECLKRWLASVEAAVPVVR